MVPKITELNWQPHPRHWIGERAVIDFPHGYTASCLRGGESYFYTVNGTYEIAVQHGGKCVYDTPITSDVLGYQSEEEANAALVAIAALPPRE